MRGYELYIEDIDGIFQKADITDDVPAMNYQSNDISELSDRKANYSQSIKLPMSKKNIGIFDYSNLLDVSTDFVYKKHKCYLLADGYLLSGFNAFLVVNKITDYFECQILSGNADFFELLKNRKMETLDLGSIILSAEAMMPSNFNDVYRYAVANYTGNLSDYLTNLLPIVNVLGVLNRMSDELGYYFDFGIDGDIQLSQHAISLVSMKPGEDSFDVFSASVIGSYSFNPHSYTPGSYIDLFSNVTSDGNGCLIRYIFGSANGLDYVAPERCDVTITMQMNGTVTGGGAKLIYLVTHISADETSTSTVTERNGAPYNDEVTVSLKKGDKLRITLYRENTYAANFDIRYRININIIGEVVPFGGKLYFSNNLGFETWFDFFKAIIQTFGFLVNVDSDKKTVECRLMWNLYTNRYNALNWSDKLHVGESADVSIHNDKYGQNNFIRFEKNSKTEFEDVGNFKIEDETLSKWKDFAKIPFESGVNNRIWFDDAYRDIAIIELLEKITDGVYELKEIKKPHLLYWGSDDYVHSNPYYDEIGITGYAIVKHQNVQEYVDIFYSDLSNKMLKEYKIIECEFNLTARDIENFNQMIPVWIEKFGGYFYVNKIKNFVSGKLTKCELVRL